MTNNLNNKAVILLSGGLDSATTAAIAKAEGYELYALSFDYGQRHRVELEAAKKVAEALGVKKHLVINFDLRNIGGSALTSEIDVPKDRGQKAEVRGQRSEDEQNNSADSLSSDLCHLSSIIPITYVPARNTIFLSFALSWAETLEAPDIFIGANAVDYSGYPDCRPEYLRAFEAMANLATKVSVEGKIRFTINAPLLRMTKAEIIRKGAELGLDYGLTWSCYDPQERQKSEDRGQKSEDRGQKSEHRSQRTEDRAQNIDGLTSDFCLPPSEYYVPCGRCDSCLFRAKGFEEAGLKDPAAGRQ